MTSDSVAGKQGHARQVLRSVASIVLAIAGLLLLYVVGAAYWHGPTFRDLLAGLGAPLPAKTALFLASFRWWALLLLLFGAFAIDILRRPKVSLVYLLLVAIGTVVTAILLHAWMYEALSQPLTNILKAVESSALVF